MVLTQSLISLGAILQGLPQEASLVGLIIGPPAFVPLPPTINAKMGFVCMKLCGSGGGEDITGKHGTCLQVANALLRVTGGFLDRSFPFKIDPF